MSDTRTQNIVLCCDGTWCGSETGTRTNIQTLADALASHNAEQGPTWVEDGKPVKNSATNTWVGYFNGVGTSGLEDKDTPPGLMGGFLDLVVYCFNGAVAADLDQRCKEAYSFIADHYDESTRIWMFGLSRGAYTVRAVAGMINNCGIIKRPKGLDEEVWDSVKAQLVDQAWEIYYSDDGDCHPKGERAMAFKGNSQIVWEQGDMPPIIFMGLLDTVGATGLPRIEPLAPLTRKPVTYAYRPFRDFVVSDQVKHVFQACSTHDRLTPFEPCPVRRKEQIADGLQSECAGARDFGDTDTGAKSDQVQAGSSGGSGRSSNIRVEPCKEVWFPGAHYDLGRQDFVFSNQTFTNAFNRWLNPLRTNVNCNHELADYPLLGRALEMHLPADRRGFSGAPSTNSIVGMAYMIDGNLLPDPNDSAAWKEYISGPPAPPKKKPPRRGLLEAAASAAASVFSGAYNALGGPMIVRPVLQFAGSLLRLQLLQPAYDIDAETKILKPLDRLLGFILGAPRGILLRDRCIPLPGVSCGFNIGKAVFFEVPSDYGSFASYKRDGRQEWFISETYNNYQHGLAAVKAMNSAAGQLAGRAATIKTLKSIRTA